MRKIIYIQLLDEGTTIYRPVLSTVIDDNIYIVGNRDDNDEKWEFEPNEIVEVKRHVFKDGKCGLIAVKKIVRQ